VWPHSGHVATHLAMSEPVRTVRCLKEEKRLRPKMIINTAVIIEGLGVLCFSIVSHAFFDSGEQRGSKINLI